MYGLTRATTTLIGVAVAGFLLWLGAQIVDPFDESGTFTDGEYWAWMGTLAAAGFTIALSQLLGGWTKWGWPRISWPVFVVGFLPALVAGLWILFFHEPGGDWLSRHVADWSDDLGIGTAVAELGVAQPVIGFGLGLLFGLTFDTTGPRVGRADAARGRPAPAVPKGPSVAGAGYAEQAVPPKEPPPEEQPVREDAGPTAETPPRRDQ
jgi:hypothetical protein